MKGFLFHPILVHFPIAFYFLEMLLLIWFVRTRDAAYLRFALFSFRLGYGFMVAAMIAGYVDAGGIVPKVRTHFFSALAVFFISTGRAFYWRYAGETRRAYRLVQVGGAVLTNVLVAVTGYFGGELVYG